MANSRLLAFVAAVGIAAQYGALASCAKAAEQACKEISAKISSASLVLHETDGSAFTNETERYYPGWVLTPTCVVEPGTPEDLSIAIKVVGDLKAPFALKSGGHASNPGFSSTTGVQFSFRRMKQVILSADKTTVEIGMGMTWAEVYKQLDGTGVNAVGGRSPGPGVGGFTLGGGYSWKTNQYGLTVDTVKSINLVLPNGTITSASADKNPDLFFALKGGLSKLGAVTSIVYHTHPQPPLVYAGINIFTDVDAVIKATLDFTANNTDPKAQIITSLFSSTTLPLAAVEFFYDGPVKPTVFEAFDNISSIYDTVGPQSFSSFIYSFPPPAIPQIRGAFGTVPTTTLTPKFLAAMKNEMTRLGPLMDAHNATAVLYNVEPFLDYGKYATDSAYPHNLSLQPLNLDFEWNSPSEDDFWRGQMETSLRYLKQVAIADGIYSPDFPEYPNYSLTNRTAEELYGCTNAKRLRKIRDQVDPKRVMDLAGGFTL